MLLGRVRLDERRLDEVHSSATLGSCYAFHKDAKLYHCRSQRTALCYLSNFRINDFSERWYNHRQKYHYIIKYRYVYPVGLHLSL